MTDKHKPFRTLYIPSYFEQKDCNEWFKILRDEIKWEEGIKSRKGHTRWAKSLSLQENELIYRLVQRAMLLLDKPLIVLGVYLNYYKNGDDYTPSHSHPKQIQCIISLGATRTLIVGKKNYNLSNGDVIFFGSSPHSVPKSLTKEGRISIATFSVEANQTIINNSLFLFNNDEDNELEQIQTAITESLKGLIITKSSDKKKVSVEICFDD